MILQSMWQRCVTSLAPLALITGCATGPVPLPPEQQAQIAQEQTAQAQVQRTSMHLQGLMTILNIRNGLTSQEIADFAGDLFLTIRAANKEQKTAYKAYMKQQIEILEKTDPPKAKQIAQIQKNVEDLEWQAEKPSRISALTIQRDAALKTGDMETARRAAIGLLLEKHAVKEGAFSCAFQEPKPKPIIFKSDPILLSTLPMLNKMDPREITHETICEKLKLQLLTKAYGSVASQVAPFKDWVYISPNNENASGYIPKPISSTLIPK